MGLNIRLHEFPATQHLPDAHKCGATGSGGGKYVGKKQLAVCVSSGDKIIAVFYSTIAGIAEAEHRANGNDKYPWLCGQIHTNAI